MTYSHASGEDDLGLVCLVLECEVFHGENTICRGSCTTSMVAKTSNYVDCIRICLDREQCRHYIWHKPGTSKEKQCWVVDSEDEGKDGVYRHKERNTITGACKEGTRFIFYKNTFYKNNQAQIWKK